VDVAISPNGARAYVTNAGAKSVSVIDTATNTVVATVGVEFIPVHVSFSPDGVHAYVTNAGSNRGVSHRHQHQYGKCHHAGWSSPSRCSHLLVQADALFPKGPTERVWLQKGRLSKTELVDFDKRLAMGPMSIKPI